MTSHKPLFTTTLKENAWGEFLCEYFDTGDFSVLPQDRIKQVYGVCFVDDKIVIGFGGLKKGWGLIGGSVEQGETLEETLRREVLEESNMEIISFKPIGYQKLTNQENGKVLFQLRYACRVKPLGEFKIDGGDGLSEKGITEIKLIDPLSYKEYFDWGEIGDYVIKRAVELRGSQLL
jgi:ADP-ribose pyrophosphatase YjhB (NUDIX family)